MKQLLGTVTLLLISMSAFPGTANCDEERQCRHLKCEENNSPHCVIIQGTSGPNGRAMGFCKCVKS